MTRLRRTRILLLSIQKAGNWTATALTWTIINQCRSTRRGSRLILIYIIHVSITARNDDIVRRQIAVLPAGSNTATDVLRVGFVFRLASIFVIFDGNCWRCVESIARLQHPDSGEHNATPERVASDKQRLHLKTLIRRRRRRRRRDAFGAEARVGRPLR